MDSDLSSDDEAFADFLAWDRRPYTIKDRPDHFTDMDDKEFHIRFRLEKVTVLHILTLIEHLLETPTDRNHSIPPMTQLLLTLRFFALGNMLITVGDFCGVSKASACKIVKKVSFAIAGLAPQFIRMPATEQEIKQAQLDFYNRARLPRIIGAIDCTHVAIQSPGGVHAENFRNRKGYFSFNVQTVASENLKILDIVARWPGSTHDQTILNRSNLCRRLMAGEFGTALIVADSGYANTNTIITPFVNAPTEAHQLYNESVIRTRNPVERSYGVWKRRFPVLKFGLRLKLETCQAVIIATAVLHNIAIEAKTPLPPDEVPMPEEDPWEPLNQIEGDVFLNARDNLLRNYFTNLA